MPGQGLARLIKGAGKDVQGVLLLHELHGEPVKEASRLLVVRRPILGEILHLSAQALPKSSASKDEPQALAVCCRPPM